MRWVFSVGYSIWEFYLKRWKIPDVRNKLRFHLRFVENAGQGSRTHSNASLENGPAPRPSLTHAGRSGWKPSHSHRVPTLLKMPQGATTDFFFPVIPQIFYSRKYYSKKLSCNTSRVFPLRPRQKFCRNNLAQGKMSVVLWSEHRVRGWELWVLIPALPLNHFESFTSHFVLEPVSNFPLEWFSDGNHHFYKTGWKLTFHWEYLVCPGWVRKDIRPRLKYLEFSCINPNVLLW